MIENIEETELRMGAEDFAYYSHEIPACFYRLGVGNISKGIVAGVHTPKFNIDESAIEIGMGNDGMACSISCKLRLNLKQYDSVKCNIFIKI
ncbi:MAG: hypothetical protein WKF59_06740 [Chitinophagaceae bacterium]